MNHDSKSWILLLGVCLSVISCRPASAPAIEDVAELASWSDGPVKDRILAFVDDVTDPSSTNYVPPAERIAVFDLDGTLVIERPFHIEVLVAAEMLRDAAAADPSLAGQDPYRAILAQDDAYVRGHGAEIVTTAAALGGSVEQLRKNVRSLYGSMHPSLGRPYSALFYAPMVELLELLREHDFDVYVVSQSQQEYIRAFAAPCLGVEPSNVIGSMYAMTWDGGEFHRTGTTWEPYNRGEGKVLRIRERTGGLPILAFGNGTGDRLVLEATAGSEPHLALLLDHDDAEREFAYGDGNMLEIAREREWTIVSMKRDFAAMFNADCLSSD